MKISYTPIVVFLLLGCSEKKPSCVAWHTMSTDTNEKKAIQNRLSHQNAWHVELTNFTLPKPIKAMTMDVCKSCGLVTAFSCHLESAHGNGTNLAFVISPLETGYFLPRVFARTEEIVGTNSNPFLNGAFQQGVVIGFLQGVEQSKGIFANPPNTEKWNEIFGNAQRRAEQMLPESRTAYFNWCQTNRLR